MVDAGLIQHCADPGLKPAIVEKFIQAVGSPEPLAITVRAGNRVILVPPPRTPDEAMELVRRYVGQAMVRVGVTQYPAGLGITDASELKPDLVDACANIKMGTALFGKIYRIVVKWYGAPGDPAFRDAIEAWGSGYFDGKYVFDQPDPGKLPVGKVAPDPGDEPAKGDGTAPAASGPAIEGEQPKEPDNPNTAGIRIDLSGIGVAKPK